MHFIPIFMFITFFAELIHIYNKGNPNTTHQYMRFIAFILAFYVIYAGYIHKDSVLFLIGLGTMIVDGVLFVSNGLLDDKYN